MDQPILRATICLLAASLVVAVAILAHDPIAKVVNGVAGVLWIGSAVLLVITLHRQARFPVWFAFVFAECLLLVLLVKPTNLLWAIFGFGLGGMLVGFVTGPHARNWASLLPALWLPTHLLVAISRAIFRVIDGTKASVRSDPPPTAALVPFAMVVAAIAGALFVDWLRNRSITSVLKQSQTR